MYYTLCLLPPILHNSVSCGANGLLGDAHDAADVAVFHAHLIEDEEEGGNIYRVFFIFDEGEIVVLFNGFQKKTQKTPQNEIEKAIKIKEAYYADKQSQNR